MGYMKGVVLCQQIQRDETKREKEENEEEAGAEPKTQSLVEKKMNNVEN